LGALFSRSADRKLVSVGIARVNAADLAYLAGLLAAGKLTPFINHSYPLSEIANAIRHVEEKHAQGKIVVAVG
jgi:NADPH:quinone reductase-like Zn-dependent oxidoreductase